MITEGLFEEEKEKEYTIKLHELEKEMTMLMMRPIIT